MRIVLIGFACSYKSTVGKLLAEKLNYEHIDTDRAVEAVACKSIADIFAQEGELSFREKESKVLRDVAKRDNVVVSCGGGSVLSSYFADLAANSTVVWLTVNATTVKSRLGETPRPLFDNLSVDKLSAVMNKREPYYAKYANLTISTDNKTSQEVVDDIVNEFQK